MSETYLRLSHSKWDCKYHVVFVPKRRRKVIFGQTRRQLGAIFHALARQKECQIIEGHLMPDHVHLIYSALRRADGWEYTLPDVMKSIKGRSARQINVALKRSGPVWQEEFFDHVLRSNDSLVDRVDYVCQNPVRAGLVEKAEDYRWSSVRWWKRCPLDDEPLKVNVDRIAWRRGTASRSRRAGRKG